MSFPTPDPVNPQQTDAASGSVFTGERSGLTRDTPKYGGRWTLIEAIIAAVILAGMTIVAALWIF